MTRLAKCCCAVLVVLAACKGGFKDSTGDTGFKDIGPEGGELRGDGVRVIIPQGALAAKATVQVVKASGAVPDGFVNAPVDVILPAGVAFQKPVTVEYQYTTSSLPDPSAPDLVRVAVLLDGDWQELLQGSVDLAASKVQGQASAAGRFAPVQWCGNKRKCPNGQACVGHRCLGIELCADGKDNDGDGLIDCADPDCAKDPSCGQVCCFDTIANQCVPTCTGVGNCYCGPGFCSRCAQGGKEICNDGKDNDGDGFVDCKDPDCWNDPACHGPVEICNDGIDNDGNGLVDCADPACAKDPVACPVCCFDTIAMSCVPTCGANGGGGFNCYCGPQWCGKCQPPRPEICNDGVDNDGDGLVDCKDPDCLKDPACMPPLVETDCHDGIDNDGDGLVDCADPDCAKDPSCPSCSATGCCFPTCLPSEHLECLGGGICGYPCKCVPNVCTGVVEVCNDGIDNDCNGLVDCADPACKNDPACGQVCCFDTMLMKCVASCTGTVNCYCSAAACGQCNATGKETSCSDGIDNDNDGLVDCADPDCKVDPACFETKCNDGLDNDHDGLVDCKDPDCFNDPVCGQPPPPEICNDGIDNDRDGLIDCKDPDCAGSTYCGVKKEICNDGIDNDGDGLVDCDDAFDCAADPYCKPCCMDLTNKSCVSSCGPVTTCGCSYQFCKSHGGPCQ